MKHRGLLVAALIAVAATAGWVAWRAAVRHEATGVVHGPAAASGRFVEVPAEQARGDSTTTINLPRTVGLWVAAFLTLAVFSFLYRDNPLYRLAEHLFVGISAAYWMAVGFWAILVPNLLGKLFPRFVKFTLQPGIDLDAAVDELSQRSLLAGVIDYQGAHGDGLSAAWWQLMDFWYWIPAILGILLLLRLTRKQAWLARWPLAFVVGITAGLRLIAYLEADFVGQIAATIRPLYAPVYDVSGGQATLAVGPTFYASVMTNVLLIVGVVCGLVYFFFSLEHKGVVGRAARVGMWVLMIAFGAGFGFTVMARIAVLVQRVEFLATDWLNLVPP